MRYSKLLHNKSRREFNPSNKEDLKELKYFIENKQWRDGCPFYAEFPWEDIPVMCLEKYARDSLAKLK